MRSFSFLEFCCPSAWPQISTRPNMSVFSCHKAGACWPLRVHTMFTAFLHWSGMWHGQCCSIKAHLHIFWLNLETALNGSRACAAFRAHLRAPASLQALTGTCLLARGYTVLWSQYGTDSAYPFCLQGILMSSTWMKLLESLLRVAMKWAYKSSNLRH